jgi:predicted nucleotidyltransferase
MPYGLSEKTIKKLSKVFEESTNTEEAIIFGSRAKGNYREGSDIDIALKGKNLDFEILKNLELKIDQLMLPYEINLVIYNNIDNKDLKKHIERVGIEIYKEK